MTAERLTDRELQLLVKVAREEWKPDDLARRAAEELAALRASRAQRCTGHCHCHAGADGMMHPPCCEECAPGAPPDGEARALAGDRVCARPGCGGRAVPVPAHTFPFTLTWCCTACGRAFAIAAEGGPPIADAFDFREPARAPPPPAGAPCEVEDRLAYPLRSALLRIADKIGGGFRVTLPAVERYARAAVRTFDDRALAPSPSPGTQERVFSGHMLVPDPAPPRWRCIACDARITVTGWNTGTDEAGPLVCPSPSRGPTT